MADRSNRREFLKASLAAGGGLWLAGAAAGASRPATPSSGPSEAASPPSPFPAGSEPLKIACIGIGGQGGHNLGQLAGENIVALCDVDDARAGEAYTRFPRARKFFDYRRLLDAMHKGIDAVVISTPDHMHASITLAALQLGKHVYCEKPLTRTVAEARRVIEATRRSNLVTQMGNSGNAMDRARANVELIRSGGLGPVREVHAWSDRPGQVWPQALDRPTDAPPVPDTLKWDLWLGVAPARPYHPAYVPVNWRGWWDFGTGALGDMGCHACNVAFWGLELRDPVAVECEVSDKHTETGPEWSRVTWEFPAREGRPAVKLHWYDGGKKPLPEVVAGRPLPSNGSIVVGEKATLVMTRQDGAQGLLLEGGQFRNSPLLPEKLPQSPGHHAEWIAACKASRPGRDYMSHFERAGVMTEVLLLGNLAVRAGGRIEWDPRQMKVTNLPEANRYLDSPYRTGW